MKLGDETAKSLELNKLWGMVSSLVLEIERDLIGIKVWNRIF